MKPITKHIHLNQRVRRTLTILGVCAASAAFAAGCQNNTQRGAGIGAAIGAAAGGIIGHQSGHGLEGAGIGAAGGALIGGAAGNAQDEAERRRYDY